MGFFAKRKRQRAAQEYQSSLARWQQETGELQEMIQAAKHVDKATLGQEANVPVQLHAGERVFQVASGAALIEPRRRKGHYVGGYSGFSFRVAKGVRYHIGGTRGTYVQAEEIPTPIDTGTVTITNQRVVFQGSKQARQWDYAKLIGYQNDERLPLTNIEVSNRQKVSGILYDKEHSVAIRFRLALALACHNDTQADFVAHLEHELVEHEATRPPPPPPS